jgi:hypothetical protein
LWKNQIMGNALLRDARESLGTSVIDIGGSREAQ